MAGGGPAEGGGTLVVGEALVDVVEQVGVPEVRRHPGGSPANVALGLARLGHRVHLLTRLGTDANGTLVRLHLERDGVVLADGSLVEACTSTATARVDAQGVAAYTFDLDWDLPSGADAALEAAGATHVHTGSIATALAPGARRVRRLVAAAGASATVSFDPNLRPSLIGPPEQERPAVEELVAASDVVKVSEEDLAWLYAGERPQEVARRWLGLGPALVVVTLGAEGSHGLTRAGEVDVPVEPVVVADTVGAGDAYMAGLLSSLLDLGALGGPRGRQRLGELAPDAVEAAMRRAGRVAALTVARPGADPPYRKDL